MITFHHLKTDSCPTCGCDIVVEESVELSLFNDKDGNRTMRIHTNGERWETRMFLCGCKIQWCPNFSRPIYLELCSKHPGVAKWRERRLALENEHTRVIREQSDLDKEFNHELRMFKHAPIK